MALSRDTKAIADQILPAITFNVNAGGLTIAAEGRLEHARYVPFDHPGKCKCCHSSELELSYVVSKSDVQFFGNRFKGVQTVQFDTVREFPDHTFFKLRCRGHVFT
jgi:hypothetical protein